MFLLKILILIFSLPLYIFFLLIKKIFSLNLYTLDCGRLGSCVRIPEIFLKKYKKIYNNYTTIIFLRYYKEPANKYVIKKYCDLFKSKKIIILNFNFLVKILDYCNYKFLRRYFSKPLGIERKYFDIYNSKQLFKLSSAEVDQGYEILRKFDINKNSKWICIHNRDKDFLDRYHGYQSYKYHDYRDFSINDFELAVSLFLKKGYYVFRIGKSSKQLFKISKKNKKVIDLTKHNLRSDFFETFLINNCSFYLGTSSGPVGLARMLRKKFFLVNISPLESVFVENWNFPVIFKKAYSIKKKKYLSIKETIEEDIYYKVDTEKLKKKKIKFINNSNRKF